MSENRLTFISTTNRVNKKGHKVYALYQCSCGNIFETVASRVRSGNTKSCGCLYKETRELANKSHGLRYSSLYSVWLNMRQRCLNPNQPSYKYYGGRGITICNRWNSYEAFYNDVIRTYVKGYELDRIDNDKGYYPGNTQWLPHKNNSQKRNYCKLNLEKAALIRQSTLSAKFLAKHFNVSVTLIHKVRRKEVWV